MSEKSWHDMGGDAAGAIDRSEHDFALWEKRVDALMVLTSGKGLFTVDGLRRALEDLGPEAFETLTYYERWMHAVNRNLIEAGVYAPDELAARIAAVRARGADYGAASLAGTKAGTGTKAGAADG
ncbi:MAG: ScnB-like protein [Pseudomonadota bacterium]